MNVLRISLGWDVLDDMCSFYDSLGGALYPGVGDRYVHPENNNCDYFKCYRNTLRGADYFFVYLDGSHVKRERFF